MTFGFTLVVIRESTGSHYETDNLISFYAMCLYMQSVISPEH